jgi:hypothetical protein
VGRVAAIDFDRDFHRALRDHYVELQKRPSR